MTNPSTKNDKPIDGPIDKNNELLSDACDIKTTYTYLIRLDLVNRKWVVAA